MKKRTIALVAAATALGSMLAAAPAQAGPGDPVACYQSPPSGTPAQEAVSVDGFDVTIRPEEIPNDVDSALAFTSPLYWGAQAYVWCVEGDTSDPVFCRFWTVFSGVNPDGYSYIEQDSDNGNIYIHGNQLVADLTTGSCTG